MKFPLTGMREENSAAALLACCFLNLISHPTEPQSCKRPPQSVGDVLRPYRTVGSIETLVDWTCTPEPFRNKSSRPSDNSVSIPRRSFSCAITMLPSDGIIPLQYHTSSWRCDVSAE